MQLDVLLDNVINFRYYILRYTVANPTSLRNIAFHWLISEFIIPHVNCPYKTSIDERLIFNNITRCYSDGECCHVFAIAAGDIIKYQGGHMMRNANARTARSRQETSNSNGGHDA